MKGKLSSFAITTGILMFLLPSHINIGLVIYTQAVAVIILGLGFTALIADLIGA